jgi:SRSO17 transposase
MSTEDAARWAAGLAAVMERIGARFGRVEPRRRALASLHGLLSPIERQNGWQLAEIAGDRTPDGGQDFLARVHWDADLVGDDLRAYGIEHLGDAHAVLVLDATGVLKKGDKSCGVQRQYRGTAGRIENCQIGVFLGDASGPGQALIERALSLPQRWAADPVRRTAPAGQARGLKAYGVPPEISFAPKPQLGRVMRERAFAPTGQARGLKAHGGPGAWVAGDSVDGADDRRRPRIESHGRGSGLTVTRAQTSAQRLGLKPVADGLEDVPVTAGDGRGWQRLSAGDGAKGPRLYDWAYLPYRGPTAPGWQKGLLIRRTIKKPEAFTFYLTLAPVTTTRAERVRVAGTRWTIESCFEAAKSLPRRRPGARSGWTRMKCARGPAGTATSPWRCWPMLILRFCARPPRRKKAAPDAGIDRALRLHRLPHTVPERRRLLWRLVWARPPDREHVLACSVWRRRHQQRARRCHWQRRTHSDEARL